MINIKESQHQENLITWFDFQYKKFSKLLFHIPNGGTRNKKEGASLKRQGVRKGIPDLFLCIPTSRWHGLFIELKSEKGKLTIEQKLYLILLEKIGYKAICCKGWEEAKKIIEEYLNDSSDELTSD